MISSEYLPPALLAQLSKRKIKSLPEHLIFSIFESSKEPLDVDGVLVAYWKKSSYIMQRKDAVYAIKNLANKNLIKPINRGFYVIASSKEQP